MIAQKTKTKNKNKKTKQNKTNKQKYVLFGFEVQLLYLSKFKVTFI